MEWATTPAGVLVSIAAAVGAWVLIWTKALRPFVRGVRKVKAKIEVVHDIANRELTHNGGTSLKDAVKRIDQRTEAVEQRVAGATQQINDVEEAVNAIAQVIDNVVDRKQEAHDAIWAALIELGYDRRNPTTEGETK